MLCDGLIHSNLFIIHRFKFSSEDLFDVICPEGSKFGVYLWVISSRQKRPISGTVAPLVHRDRIQIRLMFQLGPGSFYMN